MFVLAAALAMAAPVPKPGPDWVTVRGTVVWPEKEAIPDRRELTVALDKEHTLRGGPVTDDTFVVDATSRGVRGVVVWLRPDDDDPKAVLPATAVHPDLSKPEPTTHAVTTEFCRFDTRVVAVRAGDSLQVVNKSPVACNFKCGVGEDSVNVLLQPNAKPFVMKGLKGTTVGTFDDAIHSWAKGYVRVFDHPYFAVTNDLGEFAMHQVPRGKWRLVYWHESGFHKGKAGRLGFPVEVKGSKQAEMTLQPLAVELAHK